MNKFIMCLLLLSTSAFSATIEEAKGLFDHRADNSTNSELAAKQFNELATLATTPSEKAILKTKEAQALYYFGGIQSNDSKKKEVYSLGMEATKIAISQLDTTMSKSDKAYAHYFYAISLGKWAEANGVLSSLGKWPELKDQLDTIATLDNSIDNFGPLRTRARALHKLPFGDKNEAEKLLAEASAKTMNEQYGLSNNTTNNLYYLDILAKNRNSQKFCELYNALNELSQASDAELLEYNPEKLPETKADLKNFKENKNFEEDVKKFSDRNC